MKHLLFFLIAFSSHAFAQGSEAGNGGGLHYCPNRSFQEFYDVYEGRKRHDLDILEGEVPTADVLPNAVKKIASKFPTLAVEVEKQIAYLSSPKIFRPKDNLFLQPILDADILVVDKGCEYKQLANWDNMTNKVLVDNDYYSALPDFHKEALKLHEALYKVIRDRFPNITKSNDVRLLVAQILSTAPIEQQVINKFKLPIDIIATKEDKAPYIQTYELAEREDGHSTFAAYIHLGDVRLTTGEERKVRLRLLNSANTDWPAFSSDCKRMNNSEVLCTSIKQWQKVMINTFSKSTTPLKVVITVEDGMQKVVTKLVELKSLEGLTSSVKLKLGFTQNAWK